MTPVMNTSNGTPSGLAPGAVQHASKRLLQQIAPEDVGLEPAGKNPRYSLETQQIHVANELRGNGPLEAATRSARASK